MQAEQWHCLTVYGPPASQGDLEKGFELNLTGHS